VHRSRAASTPLLLALLLTACLGRSGTLSGNSPGSGGAGSSTNDGLPSGSVVAFAGTQIPPGWTICDGRLTPAGHPTPDLRGRFVLGADPTAGDTGRSGGSATHDHQAQSGAGRGARGTRDGDHFSVSTSGHSHQVVVSAADSLPPHLKLVYIMKD
jgi:hypothetical protein